MISQAQLELCDAAGASLAAVEAYISLFGSGTLATSRTRMRAL